MLNTPKFRIGTYFGIPIEVNVSWLAIFALVTFTLATSFFPGTVEAAELDSPPVLVYYLVAAISAVLFFASILAHELSHSLVSRAFGGHVDRITLFILGGVAQMDEEPETAGREFLMAIAGPGMSLAIGIISLVIHTVTVSAGAPWWIWSPLQYLAIMNLLVAGFNLLPGFPLDGGRVLRSILWGLTGDLLKATRWAVRVGQFIGWAMVGLAIMDLFRGSTRMLWTGLIGWFIANMAGQAYRQQVVRSYTSSVGVGEIMSREPEYVDGEQTLDLLVRDHFLGRQHTRYPVLYEGSIVGLVSIDDVKGIAQADWPFTKTVDITNKDMATLIVRAEATVDTVLARLASDQPGALIVVRDGRLAGVVTRSDVIALLQAEQERRGQES